MKGRIAAIVVTVLLTAGVVAALVFAGGGPGADQGAVRTYYRTISPLAFEGGRVLQEEIKPSISDLEEAKVTPAAFRQRAASWWKEFVDIRAKFARAPRVSRLDKTAALYDVALKQYLDFIGALVSASRKPTTQARTAAMRSYFPIGDKANKDYDSARAELKRVMHEVGMAIPADFAWHEITPRDPARSDRNIA